MSDSLEATADEPYFREAVERTGVAARTFLYTIRHISVDETLKGTYGSLGAHPGRRYT